MSAQKKARRAPAPPIPDPRFGRFCIGCGCCDEIACEGGCGWSEVYSLAPVGVCSSCSAYLPMLRQMDRKTALAIYREKAVKAQEWI